MAARDPGTGYLFCLLAMVATPRRGVPRCGFLFTAGTYLAGTYWLYHSVHTIGHAPVWLALLYPHDCVDHGCLHGALGYVLTRWVESPGAIRVAAAVCRRPSTCLEWFRGWFLSGFPWLALGYTQTDTPLAVLRRSAVCTPSASPCVDCRCLRRILFA